MRRLSEDLERPPPPPPPPPPSPPTPEEPELEEDDDAAESVVSDWALDEALDGDDGTTLTMDDLGDPEDFAAQPEPPLEGLGLHTGEPHLDSLPTPQPQPMSMDTDDLINLEDDAQPTVPLPQEEATEPHAARTDAGTTDDPPVEEATSSQGASTDAHVPDAAEKPPAATHGADPSPPSDEPSVSREAGASMPVDPFAGSNTFGSPIDDDLGNPWADLEDTSGPDTSPAPPPAADPARAATPTSDYHDANGGEDEQPEATPAEQDPEPSPVRPQEQESPTTSGNEDRSSTETPLPTETPVQGGSGDNASSGDAAPTVEEVQPENNSAPASSKDPIDSPPPATEPVQTAPPATDPVPTLPPATDSAKPSSSVTDHAQPSPSVTEPVPTPAEETTETLTEDVSPVTDPDRDETANVGRDETKDVQAEEPSTQSTTTTSGIPSSEQPQETAETEDHESAHLGGREPADKVDDNTVEQVSEEVVDKAGSGEEEAVPATTTTESPETTAPPEVTTDTVNSSPAPQGPSDDVSGVQAEEQNSALETRAVPAEAEAKSSSTMQNESTLEKSSTPLESPAAESNPPPLLSTDTTEPTSTTTAFDPPPSPTVRLASGVEAQLIDRDPESTEQTPSASPGDTPPNESSSPSQSRQASPPVGTEAPAEIEAEEPPPVPRGRVPSSSAVSPVTPVEKRPGPPRINTAFGVSSEPSSSAKPSAWQRPPTFGSALSPAAKGLSRGAGQSPPKSAGSWGRGLFSSMSSLFNPPSEPSTRESSPEREFSGFRTPALPPARQSPAAIQTSWGQKKNWSAVVSSSTSGQQSSKSKQPPAPAAEPSVGISPLAQVSPPADNTKTSSDPSPPEGPTIQETDLRTEESPDAMVLVDSGTPSAGNGEPVRDAESSRAPTIQVVASAKGDSPEADGAGGEDEKKEAEDEDMVKITADDIAGAEREEGSQSRPQGDVDPDEDEDENAPLNLRLARVRQMTGDSVSSAVTSDTETQGDEERHGPRTAPKLQTSGLASEPDGVGSPAVESPIVGVNSMCLPPCGFASLYSRNRVSQTPAQSKARKRKNKNKNKKGNGGS